MQQFNLDIQRELPFGIFVDAAYAGSRGVHLPSSNNVSINNIPDSFYKTAQDQENAGLPVTITQSIPNPFQGITTVSGLNPASNPTILAGQLDRPYPQYTGLSLVGDGCCSSNYNSFQLTVNKRFKDGGTFLAAYTNAKLLSNTDTLTTWLETGVGEPQDWNNLKGEKSLSSQDVSQRLVISYVYDLPFGHGQKYMSDVSGVMSKVVSGWGVDGVTTFQKGFPLPITYGASTSLSKAGFSQNFQLRPDVVSGCSTEHAARSSAAAGWYAGPWRGRNRLVQPKLLHRSRATGLSVTSLAWMPRFAALGSITGTSRYSRRRTSVRKTSLACSSAPSSSTPLIACSSVLPARPAAQALGTTPTFGCKYRPAEQSEAHSVRSEVPVLTNVTDEGGCRSRHPPLVLTSKRILSANLRCTHFQR